MARLTDKQIEGEYWKAFKLEMSNSGYEDLAIDMARRALVRAGVEQAMAALDAIGAEDAAQHLREELKAGRLV